MSVKSELRKTARQKRRLIHNKYDLDKIIANTLIESSFYKNAEKILCYASLDDEISTDAIINTALNDGKITALPVCTDEEGHMSFYIIKDVSDLKSGAFNVREPDIDKCSILTNYDNAIIITPGLCFDKQGGRLGYGKGYYDRFLQNKSLISVGLCYNNLILDKVPTDKYDKPIDYIITQTGIIPCNNGGKNG